MNDSLETEFLGVSLGTLLPSIHCNYNVAENNGQENQLMSKSHKASSTAATTTVWKVWFADRNVT